MSFLDLLSRSFPDERFRHDVIATVLRGRARLPVELREWVDELLAAVPASGFRSAAFAPVAKQANVLTELTREDARPLEVLLPAWVFVRRDLESQASAFLEPRRPDLPDDHAERLSWCRAQAPALAAQCERRTSDKEAALMLSWLAVFEDTDPNVEDTALEDVEDEALEDEGDAIDYELFDDDLDDEDWNREPTAEDAIATLRDVPADDELWDDIDGFIQQVRDLAGEKLAIRRVGRDLEALGAAIDDLDMAAIDAPGSLDTSDVAAW